MYHNNNYNNNNSKNNNNNYNNNNNNNFQSVISIEGASLGPPNEIVEDISMEVTFVPSDSDECHRYRYRIMPNKQLFEAI